MTGYHKPKHELSYFNNSVSLVLLVSVIFVFHTHAKQKKGSANILYLLLFVKCLAVLSSVKSSGHITVSKAGVNCCPPGAHSPQGRLHNGTELWLTFKRG